VLELGCGHCIPAISAVRFGGAPRELHLHDYNGGVVEAVSIPNVRGNLPGALPFPVRYFSGDWSTFASVGEAAVKGGYDLILSSETCYSLEAGQALAEALARLLVRGSGRALVVGKSYYFGVGGGIPSFMEACAQVGLSARIVKEISDLKGRRDIVEVARP
jgi:hypothetical protein